MTIAYTVLRRGWEYDDNYMNRSEGNALARIFTNKKDAEKCCLDLNIRDLKSKFSEGIYQYTGGDGFSSLLIDDDSITEQKLALIIGQDEVINLKDNNNCEGILDISTDQAEALLKILDPSLIDYSVEKHEVENEYKPVL